MNDFNQQQLLRMNKHAMTCKYEGAGGFTFSNRLEQEVRSKRVRKILQIKCIGCGYSLDYLDEGK